MFSKRSTHLSKTRSDDCHHEIRDSNDHSTIYRIHLRTAVSITSSTKRLLGFYFFFFLGLYIAHIILVEKSGMNEVDILNEMLEKSKQAYEKSNPYSKLNNSSNNSNSTIRPGYQYQQQGARAKYPVVMVPGFITSGLELWDGEECAKSYFRQRLWGSLPVFVQSFFTDNECWRRHLSLDPKTGLDPAENIRLRSAQGFEAADYVMSTFWVWEKIIENLADVGYDPSNMIMMPYDWRLSFIALEERDGYLTKLRYCIEAMVQSSGKKIVLTSHSMGSQIVFFFFKWVTTSVNQGGGGGGKDWVENHIHAFVNIAGPMLGVPKALTALLSGEMKDTAAIMGTMGSMVERIFGRYHRRELWKTWGSLWNMLPLGGDAIWSEAFDDEETLIGETRNIPLITFYDAASESKVEWSVNDAIHFLKLESDHQGNKFARDSTDSFSIGVENWHDPITTPLPFAPSMTIYCLYGYGIETESSYFYKKSNPNNDFDLRVNRNVTLLEDDMPFVIDTSVNDLGNNIRFGVKFSDGDVSVPLISLGYMCVDGWKENKRLNPSNLKVVTREYAHKEEFRVNDPMRGGPRSADHVDILGNIDTIKDLLNIATDFSSSHENNIHSNIARIASNISLRKNLKTKSLMKIDSLLDLGIE